MLEALNGPSEQTTLTVDTITVEEVKVGGTALTERKVVTVQPIDGSVYIYFGDGTSNPNAATMIADGFEHPKKSLRSYEATNQQQIFILAISGTVDVKIAERA